VVAEVSITGADGFLRLSKALKEAERTALRTEMNKRLKRAVQPVIAETRAAAVERLPKAGGLNKRVAKTPQRVQVRTGKDPGVRLVVGKSNSGARGANRGEVRHPVFGDRDQFVSQAVPSGWFDEPAEKAKPHIVDAAEVALQSVVDDIAKEVR
jgi:hypothetical protein